MNDVFILHWGLQVQYSYGVMVIVRYSMDAMFDSCKLVYAYERDYGIWWGGCF